MPTPPASPSSSLRSTVIRFFKRLGAIVAAAMGAVLVAAVALGQFHAFGLSNLLFWASLIVLGIAVVPAMIELGSGFTTLARSAVSKDKPLTSVVADRHAQRDRWLNNSVLYGAAGVALFVLSFLFATLFAPR